MKLGIAPFEVYRFLNDLLMQEAEAAIQYRYQASTLPGEKFEGYRKTLQQFSADLREACQAIADHVCNLGGFPRTDLEQPESFIEFPQFRQDHRMEERLLDAGLEVIGWCRQNGFRQSIPLLRSLSALHLHHMQVLEVMEEAVVDQLEPAATY